MIPNSEFKFYKAILFKNGTASDNRCQVRILPDMRFVDETEALPWYPPLFKGNVITGFAEDDSKRPDGIEPEMLLVMATKNFSVGYIVGKMNNFASTNEGDKFGSNYNWKSFYDYTNYVGTLSFNFQDMIVQNFVTVDENDKESKKTGGLLEAYNYKTGAKFIVNSAGFGMIIDNSQILLTAFENQNYKSFIQLTPKKLNIKVPCVDILSDWIFLGHSGKFVASTSGQGASNCDGKDFLAGSFDLLPGIVNRPKGVYV